MKKILVVLVLVLSVSFVSAYGFGGSIEMRFGGGLSYKFDNNIRESVENFDSWGERVEKFGFDNDRRFGGKVSGENFYYKYVAHLREWRKVSCYNSAPADKLFYIKCPN